MDYLGLFFALAVISGLIEGYFQYKTEKQTNSKLTWGGKSLKLGPKYFLFWWEVISFLPIPGMVLFLSLDLAKPISENIMKGITYLACYAMIKFFIKIFTKSFWISQHSSRCINPSQCFYCKPDEEEQDETLFQLGIGDNFQSSYFGTDCANKEKVKR